MKPFVLAFVFLWSATLAFAQGAVAPVQFQPGADFLQRVQSPSPGPGATNKGKKEIIGEGKTALHTGNPNSVFWSENIDLSGAGKVLATDMLWDGSSKILYAFAHTTLRCVHGGKTIDTSVLLGLYGKKNFLEKPAGSGWWVVSLDKDECDITTAGLYGCKFTTSGQLLACGKMEIDPRINDMQIVDSTRF